MSFPPATPSLTDPAAQDLGPLTWVVDDVRRCLEQAAKAVATGQPALAEAPLHQAAGAIEMAGSSGASGVARVVGAMELLARHLAAHPPADVTAAGKASQAMSHAGFAVTDFLDAVLHGRVAQPVALYPNYSELLALAGEARAPGQRPDRVLLRAHPSVLWTPPSSLDLSALEGPEPESYDEAVESIELSGSGPDQFHVAQRTEAPPVFPTGAALRARLDPAVLSFVKTGDAAAARELCFLCAGLVRQLPADDTPAMRRWRRLWRLAAAFFEAMALDPSRADLPAKRCA
jgi:chemosensory pili system protein ChpA (sensor histidine kinase/response regulator)